MTFVNERIAEEDSKKYGLDQIDARWAFGGTSSRQWTVDQERQIRMRQVSHRVEFGYVSSEIGWTIHWGNQVIDVRTITVSRETIGSHRHIVYRLLSLEVPASLGVAREEVIAAFREALLVYGDGGIYSGDITSTVTLLAATEGQNNAYLRRTIRRSREDDVEKIDSHRLVSEALLQNLDCWPTTTQTRHR
ncbi:MAG: hypothetical protein Q8R98_12160 [Rubrivivax sp.]|nr:hypothetical protein [Rubrivivax sp.]MDP3223338.1 hypothetical protein [Rubrivivax sp.]MDP3612600.1 hypothetical protein [Rubrivivax sp.]